MKKKASGCTTTYLREGGCLGRGEWKRQCPSLKRWARLKKYTCDCNTTAGAWWRGEVGSSKGLYFDEKLKLCSKFVQLPPINRRLRGVKEKKDSVRWEIRAPVLASAGRADTVAGWKALVILNVLQNCPRHPINDSSVYTVLRNSLDLASSPTLWE